MQVILQRIASESRSENDLRRSKAETAVPGFCACLLLEAVSACIARSKQVRCGCFTFLGHSKMKRAGHTKGQQSAAVLLEAGATYGLQLRLGKCSVHAWSIIR